AEARLEALEDLGLDGTRGILILPSGRASFRLPLPGLFQAENFLAAATAAHALGLQVDDIASTAEELAAAPHRGTVLHLKDDITVIDDSYNASPEAVIRALELLAQCSGRRMAVLGEMFELGSAAAAAHRDIGRLVASHCDLLLTVGRDMSNKVLEGAVAAGLPRHRAFQVEDSAAATAAIEGLLEPGDTILIKGSRGVGLDRVVADLTEGRS
ncbi:MAG: cyanophycin synthetase, partial [Acidobacteriota bacterium]